MGTKRYKMGLNQWRKEVTHDIVENAHNSDPSQWEHPSDLFHKNRYKKPEELLSHVWYLGKRIRHVKVAAGMTPTLVRAALGTKEHAHHDDNALISAQFRERLMLAVTSVNACSACSYAHARAALVEGLHEDEIDQLLSGHFENCPREDQPALLYAQHWAEHEGKPERDARNKLFETYGKEKALAIEFTIGSIRIGNYIGNTLEYFQFKHAIGKERKAARKELLLEKKEG